MYDMYNLYKRMYDVYNMQIYKHGNIFICAYL